MADINDANYFGGPRHAPVAHFSHGANFGHGPVGSFSRPADSGDVGGTSHILNQAGRSTRAPSRRSPVGSLSASGGPGALTIGDEAARLSVSLPEFGQKKKKTTTKPSGPTKGEQMSDADAPTQGVKVTPTGEAVHTRANPATGQVSTSPVSTAGAALARKAAQWYKQQSPPGGGPAQTDPEDDIEPLTTLARARANPYSDDEYEFF